ncbi:MAG: peptidase dimerization domain protein [Flavobacteriales bacterium]|nr:peptidase dimerization domain protein [Flavobacteriales bacterium]|tara:strand:- start:1609 stop:2973 length:1365 start_codon:yes stop_codon:yes gene_type:complete
MDQTQQKIKAGKKQFLDDLLDLLRIPSVSADSSHNDDTRKCAEWVKTAMDKVGLQNTRIHKTPGHPVVFGEFIKDASLPTVLIYGHYDVQPADPLELWTSPPFEPVIKEQKIYARGAADDKGQFFMYFAALESMIQANELPCNVKVLIEGEEEVGSENLEAFVLSNKKLLSNDVILISDTHMISNENPSITAGLKGLAYMEVELTGPNRDLHSGTYGGSVGNPINILCKMIASLTNENNQITIPEFYDKVVEVSPENRDDMARAPFDLEEFKKSLDIEEEHGEVGYSTPERQGIRPTLDVNGIWGGYTGEGAKTVLPSKAFAKISMRLVPNQNSEEISKIFQQHFESIAPKSVKVKVFAHHGGEPAVTDLNSKGYLAASKAMETTFGKKPVPVRQGGSIPIVSLFEEALDSNCILMGFGLNSDSIHSPNEHFGLFNFYKGIETIPYFFKFFSEE